MQLNLEEEKDDPKSGRGRHHGLGRFDNNGAASELTSTFHSIDLPPVEYEQ